MKLYVTIIICYSIAINADDILPLLKNFVAVESAQKNCSIGGGYIEQDLVTFVSVLYQIDPNEDQKQDKDHLNLIHELLLKHLNTKNLLREENSRNALKSTCLETTKAFKSQCKIDHHTVGGFLCLFAENALSCIAELNPTAKDSVCTIESIKMISLPDGFGSICVNMKNFKNRALENELTQQIKKREKTLNDAAKELLQKFLETDNASPKQNPIVAAFNFEPEHRRRQQEIQQRIAMKELFG